MRLRLIFVLSLVFAVGAFKYATPQLLSIGQPAPLHTSSLKIDVSYESEKTAQPNILVNDYGQVEQGSFFLQYNEEQGQNAPAYLLSPLLDTQVQIKVTGLIARVKVTQMFTNTTDRWVNGIYVFPLPENAAVDHLEMHIGERHIVGEIHPKEKAKAMYEVAKKAGKKASLLVQQRPNLFKNAVANIAPQEQIHVTIEYQQPVSYQANTFSLRFPTTVTKRYLAQQGFDQSTESIANNGWGISQPTYASSKLNAYHEPVVPLNKVSINVFLNTGFELHTIDSEFHPITHTHIADGTYKVSLQQDMIANQDFVLTWQPKPSQHPTAAHFMQKTQQGVYGMVMLMPPDTGTESQALPREVVFVVDTSGSMSGESMHQAKLALAWATDNLSGNDTFNIVPFNSYAHKMWPIAKLASNENKRYAASFINNLSADGGTEIMPALQLALGQQDSAHQRIRQVIFITDGSVSNEARLFTYIHNNLQKSRLFTVGIGSAPNSFFMSEAARMGKGSFTYIGAVDSVQSKMQDLFTKLTHPVIADLLINLPVDVEFYPRNLPDLYKDEPLMVSYKAPNELSNVTVTGTLKNQYWQKSLSLHNGAEQTGIDVLWARRKIAQLSRDKRLGGDHQALNAAIQSVAMTHHLVSAMTSLIAVDKTPTALQISQDVQVKNQQPKGQINGILPQTATSAQLQLLLAFILMGCGLCLLYITRRR